MGAICGIILFAGVSFWLFWEEWAVAGVLMTLVCVVLIERVLHSEYVFRDDQLIICHGRFARKKAICLTDIVGYKPMTATFGLSRFLILGLRGDRFVLVQPANETSFLKCLAERKNKIKRKDEDN
ncbi:MAG TPA: hypothetical protein DD401_08565 [Prevotella sp.]|nr:hypothetical protein [Prevotella sp.]